MSRIEPKPTIPDRVSERVPVLFGHWGNSFIRGSEQCLLDLVSHLDKDKFRPLVVCNQPILADAAGALGIKTFLLPSLHSSGIIAPRDDVRSIETIAKREKVRLVHCNSSEINPTLVRVSRNLRVPLVAHLHLMHTASERRHSLLHQASMLVGVSRASLSGFNAEGVPERKLRVIYNAVDGVRISRGDARGLRQELGISPESIVLGYVGSLIHRKGVDILLRAMSHVHQDRSDVHLLIAGDGVDRDSVRALAAELNLLGCVHFLGERRDAGAIFRDAVDIGVSAAREETFGLTLIEAGYFGRPVVASDIEAHREVVVDGGTGLLALAENAEALAAQIIKLCSSASDRKILGEAASAKVKTDFALDRYVAEFAELYSKLIAMPASRFGWLHGTVWPSTYTSWAADVVRRRLGMKTPQSAVQ